VAVGTQLAIELESLEESVVVVRIAGEIDMSTTPELVERLLPAAESGLRGLVVDLSGVGFMGAAGIHVLEQLQDALRRRGGELAVVAPGGIPLRVLEITKLAGPLGAVPTIEAARARLG
jgi:anti-sigma B factor antagonist